MRRSGKRSTFSALRSLLPVVLLIAFVVWVLWRRRSVEARVSGDAVESLSWSDGGEPAPAESLELPRPASVVVTPVRWEPPVRSAGPVADRRTSLPDAADESPPGARSRGRIEDLLERARNEDEGAA